MTPSPLARDCHAVIRALWDYLDRALEEAEMAAIDAHLAECAWCRAHTTFERRLIDEIRAARAQHVEVGPLRERVLELLRRTRGAEPAD